MLAFLLKFRHASFAIVVLALVWLALYGKRVSYEQSIQSFFAEDDPAIIDYRRTSESFGDDNFVFVGYEDADLLTNAGMVRVGELVENLKPIDGVLRIESIDAMPLLWAVDDFLLGLQNRPQFLRKGLIETAKISLQSNGKLTGIFKLAAAVRGGTKESNEELRQRLIEHPLFRGTLIDGTGKYTAVVVRLKKTHEHNIIKTIDAIRDAADSFATRHEIDRPSVVGPPVLLADGFSSIETDGRRLAAVGMVLIGLVMLTAVRSLWWALIPMAAGWVVWLGTEMVMATYGLKLSLSGGPLVAQIIVLTMPAASHLAIHFRDERRHTNDRRTAALATLKAVWVPVVWCAITGAIGYGALVTSNVLPIQQFGWILAICTLVAAILVMFLAPTAMMPAIHLEWPAHFGTSSRLGKMMDSITLSVLKRPERIVIGVIILILPLCLGIFRLRYETNYINAFRSESRVVQDYNLIENRLGGIGLFGIAVPIEKEVTGATINKLNVYQAEISKFLNDTNTPKPISVATVLDPDGRLAREAKGSFDSLIATKLELIDATPQAALLRSFLNRETGEARIMVRMREQQPATTKSDLFRMTLLLAREQFGSQTYLSGLSFLMTRTTQGVIQTQWTTFLWSVTGILVMLTIALRGPVMAALAIMPTLLAVGFVLGLMGWLDVKLDMATALVASVALGLSVDDTFHCLLQYKRCRKTHPFRESLLESYSISGPGVLLSSIAVAVGFAALRLSEFVPFVNFGTMVGIATAGSTLGNLFLLPACLTLLSRLEAKQVAPTPEPEPEVVTN